MEWMKSNASAVVMKDFAFLAHFISSSFRVS